MPLYDPGLTYFIDVLKIGSLGPEGVPVFLFKTKTKRNKNQKNIKDRMAK